MRILVRLPNWLGDVVMSLGFINKLKEIYPQSDIDIIIKKGLEDVLQNIQVNAVLPFSKKECKGLTGAWKFGKQLSRKNYDLFFCLPDSFSSAVMGFASSAKQRVGFKKELRSFLLTHAYVKPQHVHRAEAYITLLENFTAKNLQPPLIKLAVAKNAIDEKYIVININSEAVSRRLPLEKAVEIISAIQQQYKFIIKLIGSPADKIFVDEVVSNLPSKENIEVAAGKTSLQQLIVLLSKAYLVISSDSGPAHIASAASVPLVVIFGAGNEHETGPYKNDKAIVVRNGLLPCEPCVKNTCKLQPLPLCLQQLDVNKIIHAAESLLNMTNNL